MYFYAYFFQLNYIKLLTFKLNEIIHHGFRRSIKSNFNYIYDIPCRMIEDEYRRN